MDYFVGDVLWVDGDTYEVVGKISYRNTADGKMWTEYRLFQVGSGREKWLSVDTTYDEYSISEVVGYANMAGYHQVDTGKEVVARAWGRVDVETGDSAYFTEYEDDTEEKIISVEIWDDGEEKSVGYYLDREEFYVMSHASENTSGYQANNSQSMVRKAILILAFIAFSSMFSILPAVIGLFTGNSKLSIEKWIRSNSEFRYVTTITGADSQKAQVYTTDNTIEDTSKNIIYALDGNVESVQQNTEDGDDSVAILTSKEYCLIYTSEYDETMVQVSSRKYVYGSDQTPYRSNRHTYRYYRRYYYTNGYDKDSRSFGSSKSTFTNFGDTRVDTNYGDSLSSYSDTVRQESIGARVAAGGGTSYGK
ncbi:MAG: DUF4178 domain-containing protein [Eubacteriales bacterium]|nr:DUF4178 domain-containing protein [Eubacteriales bacterium]